MHLTNLAIDGTPILSVPYRTVNERRQVAFGVLDVTEGHVDELPDNLHALLVASDLQALDVAGPRFLGEVLAEELFLASGEGAFPDASSIGVILAGDLSCRPDLDRRGGMEDVTAVWQTFADYFRWVVGVAGNHDLYGGGATLEDLERTRKEVGVDILHNEIVEKDDLRIAGFGGIVGTNCRPWRTPSEEFHSAVDGLMGREPEILVLHEGPAGIGSSQPGNEVIQARLKSRSRTGLVICGHSHWDNPHCQLTGNLDVLNVDFRCILIKSRSLSGCQA